MAALQKIPAPDVLHMFIEHLRGERRLAEKTCEAYSNDISEFLGFLTSYLEKPITLPDITAVEARGFRAYLVQRRRSNRPLSAASIQRQLSALRTFYRYIERRWDAANAALPLIKGPRVKRPLPKAVSAAEALKIVKTPLDSPALARSERLNLCKKAEISTYRCPCAASLYFAKANLARQCAA